MPQRRAFLLFGLCLALVGIIGSMALATPPVSQTRTANSRTEKKMNENQRLEKATFGAG